MNLEDRIFEVLKNKPNTSCSEWSIANALYDDCMLSAHPANGARIANIRRASYNSDKLIQFGGIMIGIKRG
jgi:hypothetical protein